MFELILVQIRNCAIEIHLSLFLSSNPTHASHSRNYFIRILVKSLNAAPFILFYVIFLFKRNIYIKLLSSFVFAYCSHYALFKKNI